MSVTACVYFKDVEEEELFPFPIFLHGQTY